MDISQIMGHLVSAANVRMELPVLVQSLKSSILSSTSLQMDTFLRSGECCCKEQSRRNKANMVAWGDEKFGP